jgi:serine protease inhibitor
MKNLMKKRPRMQPRPSLARLTGMRNSWRVLAGVTAAALLAAGCGSSGAPGPGKPAPNASAPVISRGVAAREPAADPRPYGTADTAFGLDVLRAWCQAEPQANLVFSPASLATGLGMAYLGARGGTAQAMASVLHLPAVRGQQLQAGLQARSAALRGLDSPGVTVADSDQVWTDPSLITLRSYLNAVATAYGAGVARVPLLKYPEKARVEINGAVAAATRGQLPQLLAPGSLGQVGWVLTDALYLHAAWATPFDLRRTSAEPFRTAAGPTVTAKFMKGGGFRVAKAGGWTAVRIPYRGGRLAMEALLPDSGSAGCPVLSSATLGTISAGLANSTNQTAIALPKVSLSSSLRMNGLLSELGMGIAFGGSADFSGLSPQACCIGFVQHAATLRVGEQGTVASAATAVGVLPTATEFEVDFNRPYLMVVTDTRTGEPLFMARVTNPQAS